MCLVLLAWRVVPGVPLVLLANRDEHYDRPFEAPRSRGGDPEIVCGLDLKAGGTWLGRNAAGVVAALTNRPGPQDATLPSRGDVPFAALRHRSAEAGARAAAERLARTGPNSCSLLVADRESAWFVAHDSAAGGRAPVLRHEAVRPGLRTFTNLHDLDGLPAETVLRAAGMTPGDLLDATTAEARAARLRDLAGSHASLDGVRSAPCVHARGRGTVCSAVLELGDTPTGDRFTFAGGPPCVAAYTPVPDAR